MGVPPAFRTELTMKSFRKGEDTWDIPRHPFPAEAPVTRYHGWFGPKNTSSMGKNYAWTVEVSKSPPRRLPVYAFFSGVFGTSLNETPDLRNRPGSSTPRLERRQFPWGKAVSFICMTPTTDTGIYAPHNCHLSYVVRGFTPDHRYTIEAELCVNHPGLVNWGPKVRELDSEFRRREKDYPDYASYRKFLDSMMRKDRGYRLVDRCPAGDFEPPLTAFDAMLRSLAPGK